MNKILSTRLRPGVECAEWVIEEVKQIEKEREEALAKYMFMVERAADQKLDGYRELGARAATAENERDNALACVNELKAEMESLKNSLTNTRGELIASLAEEKAAVEAADKLTAENEELKKQVISLEGQLSCAHAFHDLAVKERDFARVQLRHAEADAEQAISILEHEKDEALRAVKNLELGVDTQDQILTRRFNEQLSATTRAERERDTLVRMLVSEFGWEDSSYLHAIMHVENAIRNLKADLATFQKEYESIK